MSNASRSLGASDKHERAGPDYFGYYSSEVVNLLSQDEDVLFVATQTSELPQSKLGEGRQKNSTNHHDNCSGPLYIDGIGIGLSDLKKDRLRSLLRQCVTALSSEVDEVEDPVFATYQLQSNLRSKWHSLNHTAIAYNDVVQIPRKKSKVSSSSSASLLPKTTDVNPKYSEKVNGDLPFLSDTDCDVKEMVKKSSNELSGTLDYMEQQMELLLDAVISKYRPMTLDQKQQLQRSIQKLPARNLDRVVEIICRNRPVEERSCDKIFVDLEKEDNVALWRLYFYVEAVEKAERLSCGQET